MTDRLPVDEIKGPQDRSARAVMEVGSREIISIVRSEGYVIIRVVLVDDRVCKRCILAFDYLGPIYTSQQPTPTYKRILHLGSRTAQATKEQN